MKTRYQILYWRDIPAQVRAGARKDRISRPLSERFQAAIDAAAMVAGKSNTDDYLEEWRIGEWLEADGDPESVVEAAAAQLENSYSNKRLSLLVKQNGWAEDKSAG
jgi:hypothetical protein